MRMLSTYLYIINIVIYFLTTSWLVLYDKHRCTCSKTWYQMYMRIWIIYMVFHILLNKNMYLDYALMVGQLIFVVISLVYIQDIIKNKCKCSQKDKAGDCIFYIDISIIFIALLVYIWLT